MSGEVPLTKFATPPSTLAQQNMYFTVKGLVLFLCTGGNSLTMSTKMRDSGLLQIPITYFTLIQRSPSLIYKKKTNAEVVLALYHTILKLQTTYTAKVSREAPESL